MRCLPFLIPVLWCVTACGCDEALPARDEPEDALVASASTIGEVVTFAPGANEPADAGGAFFLQLRNIYDEVLQDTVLVTGEVDVWLRDHPGERATVSVENRHLMNNSIIRGKIVTLGPDSAATLLRQWNHRTAEGNPFWRFAPYTIGYTPLGDKYFLTDSVFIVARARVQVFKPLPPEEAPEISFFLRYRIFVVDTPSLAGAGRAGLPL